MNILQLEYFVALAKYESFRKVADALYVSQPAVSKQITNLERELGLTLFLRGYRFVTLTSAGRILYDAVIKGQETFDAALKEAKQLSAYNQTVIRFGILQNADFGNLFDIVAQYQKRRSDIVLHIERVPMAELLFVSPDGKYDMVINQEDSLQDLSNFEIRNLGKRRHMGFIAQRHNLCSKLDLNFSDLCDECFYMPSSTNNTDTLDYCAYICEAHGFSPKEIILLPNVESVLSAVHTGMGAAVLDDLIYIPPCYDIRAVSTDITYNVLLVWHVKNRNPAIFDLADELCSKLTMGSLDV